ncbi:Hypothetical predicted protein [Lecanosticta acicola]|uniref:Uncharacterized protein n=1 Tax=Lecanosticta acicola TaxID=111012 RepID=A0AAI8Z0D7_9PEZI|nr:Hypothetical predicted protein [Lecanosticta acicola]
MYRTNDPRFRRRLNEIGQTLENANESAQSSLYIFGENYIKPCFSSVGQCLTTCVDASCPSLHISQRDRLRRNRGRSRGRAELSFDFYDDWDEDENDGLLGGWGNEEFDRLVGSGGGGYGTVAPQTAQPGRKRGMSYGAKGGRKKSVIESDPTVKPGSSGFWGKLFGGSGKGVRYKPGAADLQEHPGARRTSRDLTEGEALLHDIGEDEGDGSRRRRGHARARSGTVGSHETSDSYSSRGDIFPSDEEDDAIPLDDEFAMVLERRATPSIMGDTESSSQKTESQTRRKSKRPSTGSRTSTRRTASSRSVQSSGKKKTRSRARGTAQQTPEEHEEEEEEVEEQVFPSLSELKQEERRIEEEEEASISRKRGEAQRLAAERGLTEEAILSSKEATPQASREPSQLPTPVPTDDEDENTPQTKQQSPEEQHEKKNQGGEEEEEDTP